MPGLAKNLAVEISPKILFLYTFDFPGGDIEPYLFNELPYLSEYFQKVIIIPIDKKMVGVTLPQNVEVIFVDDIYVPVKKNQLLIRNLFFISGILIKEFMACKSRSFFLKRFRLTLSELLYAFVLAEKIKKLGDKESLPILHYSFWMNDFPLSLSILKQKKQIQQYTFRVHGFDLYEERREQNYIPFRERNYKYSSAVFAVSKLGLNYIKKRFTYSEKARCSYLGTLDHGNNLFSDQSFTIVTCSGIVPLKRLDLLAKALSHFQHQVNWYHFGDGNEKDKSTLKKITDSLSTNIKKEFKGQVSQEELFDFYRSTPVSVFINVSETEGLPVSIMEAISFGIPVIATDAGGVSEIVTPQTGWLIPKNITDLELADKIIAFKNSELNTNNFRKSVKGFWNENFSAQKNYPDFCNQLLSLN